MTEGRPPSVTLEERPAPARDLGYLGGGVERFVFRRAFAGRGGLFLPGDPLSRIRGGGRLGRGGRGGGAGLCRILPALRRAARPPVFRRSRRPALLSFLLALAADRSRSPAGAATAAGLAAAGSRFLPVDRRRVQPFGRDPARALLWGVPVALAAMLAARSVRSGYLARAYAHSRVLPGEPRRRVFLAAALTGIVAAVVLLASPGARPAPAPARSLAARPPGRRRGAWTGWRWTVRNPTARRGNPRASLDAGHRLVACPWRRAPPEIWSDARDGGAGGQARRAGARARASGRLARRRAPARSGRRGTCDRLAPALRLASSAPVSAADRRRLRSGRSPRRRGCPCAAVGMVGVGAVAGLRRGRQRRGPRRRRRRADGGPAGDRGIREAQARRAAGGDRVSAGAGHPAGRGERRRAPRGGGAGSSASSRTRSRAPWRERKS